MFENSVLRRIFGSKKVEVTTEAYGLHSSPYNFRVINSRRIEMGWACSAYGGEESSIQDCDGDTCGKETTWNAKEEMGG